MASPVPQKTWTLKGVLDVLESVSKILAAVAIPFAIAVGSWWIQSSQNTQSVSKDYVNMALSLPQKKPENDQERELRDWAVDLLDNNAPTKLPPKTKTDLKSGELNFGDLFRGGIKSTPPTFGFAVSPDSKNLAVGGYGESIRIFDLATGKLVLASAPQYKKIPLIALPSTPSARTTVTPKSIVVDGMVEAAIENMVAMGFELEFVSALAYSPDGQKLLFGTSEGRVKLWNLKTGEILNFEHEKAAVAAVAFTSGGNNVLVRDSNGRIQTFDGAGKRVGEVKLRSEE
jgi:WD40 repeat protein